MLKKTLLLLIGTILIVFVANAQKKRPIFRKGYQRIGASFLGSKLDNNLSPKENVFKGNFGAGTGLVFESGHIFYFKSTKKATGKFNYGLDWTITSMTYNKMNGWEGYGNASGAGAVDISGNKLSLSMATKLGPVLSFNPVEKLVINVRFQAAPTIRVSDLQYMEDEGLPAIRSFSFYNLGQEEIDQEYDAKSFKNVIAFGINTNLGITIQRNAFGLAFEYISANEKTNYDAYEGENNHTFGKEKIKTHCLQLKLNLSL